MAEIDPIPTGFHTVAPHLVVKGGAEAIDFYKAAFGAEEIYRLVDPNDGRVGHAELRIGSSMIMLADEYPDFGALGPASIGGSPVKLHLSVPDVDAMVARAIAAGATLVRAVADEFHGNRMGTIADPFGHQWSIATQIERLTPAEMQRRWTAMLQGG
ncbi:MAG: VOC family protein [Rhodospirillales bacterium]|nr:MAG: VOC family protein [Rhodospirillales bacterium]